MRTPQKTPGRIGAKRQSWFAKNPRDLLRKAMMTNPRASEKEVFDQVCAALAKDQGYWGAIVTYWFANNYRQFHVEEVADNSVTFIRQTRKVERQAEERGVVSRMKAALKVALMDFVLSNGKMLRDATFGDCEKDGGWLLAISKCGHAHEIVGKKLTEADLRNLQKRFQDKRQAA